MNKLSHISSNPKKTQIQVMAHHADSMDSDLEAKIESSNVAPPENPQEGGLVGWMTVAGSWLILFGTNGNLFSFGVYEDFYTRIFLTDHTPSSISWIGSFQFTLSCLMGPLSGRLFDAGHARLLLVIGSLLFVFSTFMLSLAQEGQYCQVFLSQGLGIGLGVGFLFTPSSAIVGVYFKRRRSLAYGTTLSGISTGATLFPIGSDPRTSQLFPKIGFASTVRATGYITLGCLVAGNALICAPPRGSMERYSMNISTFFHDSAYLWFLLSAVIVFLSIKFPSDYIQLYAITHNVGGSLSFYAIAILNGVSIIGRVGGSWLADQYGVWNAVVLANFGTAATMWSMTGTHNPTTLVVFSCLYGIFSGAWLTVILSGLVSLASSPKEVGARVGVAYAFESIGFLLSEPIQGALLSSEFHWIRPIVFSATLMSIAAIPSIIIRTIISRRKNSQRI